MVRDNHPAGFFAYFFSFDRFVKGEVERKSALSSLQSAKESILAKEQKISQLEADLKIEREWRQRLQTASVVDKEALAKGKVELTHLQPIAKDYQRIVKENEDHKDRIRQDEKTLEELAAKLSTAKLEIDSLREKTSVLNSWLDDGDVHDCPLCGKDFGLSRRKHHCRHCGGIYCDPCSDNKLVLASSSKPVRVCDNCYPQLLDKMATKN